MNLLGARRRSTTSCKEEIENYAKRNSTVFITRDYTIIKLIRLSNFYMVILLLQLLINDRTTLCGTPVNLWLDAHRSLEAQKTAPLLVCSSIATTPCRKVIAAYALNYLKLRVLKLTLVGTVLYNAIKEYYDDGMRKTIYFHGHTVEDNYNAICEKWKRLSKIRCLLIWDALKQQIAIHANYIENSGSNVTVLDDYHDNDVDNILMKCIDDERQRYNILIEDYNCAGKREDNILTVDKCRTGHSNKEDIEADEREEETRVQLRELSGEIHDILLREFRGADDFTESVTHNDDEQELELEDCDALVERYEEEINCSDLYSTV
ncbi:hypothetical protein HBI49_238100 [Parastagonospora nodorum]|nr:hypothetical protein HBI49_238100 [Parastagonospora nodorum]